MCLIFIGEVSHGILEQHSSGSLQADGGLPQLGHRTAIRKMKFMGDMKLWGKRFFKVRGMGRH